MVILSRMSEQKFEQWLHKHGLTIINELSQQDEYEAFENVSLSLRDLRARKKKKQQKRIQ